MHAPLTASRSSRHAAGREADNDNFIGEDIGYPNRRAQYRGYRLLLGFILFIGLLALIGGVLESANRIAGAFPTGEALLEGAAWAKFFGGLGQLATVGAIVVAAALLLRWRIRHARRRTYK